jgi:hypothetical protein
MIENRSIFEPGSIFGTDTVREFVARQGEAKQTGATSQLQARQQNGYGYGHRGLSRKRFGQR